MPLPTKPPTTEQGSVHPGGATGLPGWQSWLDQTEYVPDLMWPLSREVYDRMISDAQIKGLLQGTILPIRRFRWTIDRNGARPEIVEGVARDLNLPIKGEPEDEVRGRRRGRFSHDRHLNDALRSLAYGHYYFEQVGDIGEDGRWHLKKLAARPPRTISEINVAQDGGLKSIKVPAARPKSGVLTETELGVDRLVAYIWDQEAGSWTGRSMLRSCYRNWLIKDRLVRVDAIKHERTGMGVPVMTAPQDAGESQMGELSKMARAFKVTEEGGGAIPHGASLELVGTKGTIPDTIASLRWHNEEMARNFLMMFMQLGQTETGSRALGSEFIDFFVMAQEAIADWYRDVTQEHVIEDWVDWNYGEGEEQVPMLSYERVEDESLAVADLATLVKDGVVEVDEELEDAVRTRYKLPPKPEQTEEEPPPPPVPVPNEPPQPVEASEGGRSRPVLAADSGSPSLSLPDRPLRRQPYDHEILAAVDFKAIDDSLNSRLDDLVSEVEKLQAGQIDELHDLIIEANGDIQKLAAMQATPVSQETITAAMTEVAEMGIEQAVEEADRQGKKAPKKPGVGRLTSRLNARAAATDQLLARSLSEAASRQAVRRTAASLKPSQVAAEVRTYMQGLTGSYLRDQLGGSLTQAMNTGRKEVFNENNPKDLYASELLDESTCENCAAVDGTRYSSVEEAEGDYPTGGNKDCLGQERCRGTLVAVYDEAEATQ